MRDAYLGRLDLGQIRGELERQLGAFVEVMGRAPEHIDGHQHVHLLPGVREAVAETAKRIGAYVRSTREPIDGALYQRPSPVEAAFLSWTSRPLDALIARSDLRANRGFRGPRTFRETEPYRSLFRRIIAGASNGCLVMCHPGLEDNALATRDPITHAREAELQYFSSDEFSRDLVDAGLKVGTLCDAIAGTPRLSS